MGKNITTIILFREDGCVQVFFLGIFFLFSSIVAIVSVFPSIFFFFWWAGDCHAGFGGSLFPFWPPAEDGRHKSGVEEEREECRKCTLCVGKSKFSFLVVELGGFPPSNFVHVHLQKNKWNVHFMYWIVFFLKLRIINHVLTHVWAFNLVWDQEIYSFAIHPSGKFHVVVVGKYVQLVRVKFPLPTLSPECKAGNWNKWFFSPPAAIVILFVRIREGGKFSRVWRRVIYQIIAGK